MGRHPLPPTPADPDAQLAWQAEIGRRIYRERDDDRRVSPASRTEVEPKGGAASLPPPISVRAWSR